MFINRVWEAEDVVKFLLKRNLLKAYQKAKGYILSRNSKNADLKPRRPKSSGVWYFRVNKQYRAMGLIDQDTLKVFKIDDHSKS